MTKLFEVKSLPQLLYGTQLGPCSLLKPALLKPVQSNFFRAILQVLHCVSNCWLHMEAGMVRIKSKTWWAGSLCWLKLTLFLTGLAPLTLEDSFQSRWKQAVYNKLYLAMSKSRSHLSNVCLTQTVKQRLVMLLSFPWQIGEDNTLPQAMYLTQLNIPNQSRDFTFAWYDALHSALLSWRYQKKKKNPHVQLC